LAKKFNESVTNVKGSLSKESVLWFITSKLGCSLRNSRLRIYRRYSRKNKNEHWKVSVVLDY
jgi:hypothetical protein